MNSNYETQWNNRFNELCHEVFLKNKIGAQLLKLLEDKHFRSPVAFPDKDPSWAFFNEGKNDMIRSFSTAIQTHMNKAQQTSSIKTMKRAK